MNAVDAVNKALSTVEPILGLFLVPSVVRVARAELAREQPELGNVDALEAIHAALFAANEARTLELRPDAGNLFSAEDVALCPRIPLNRTPLIFLRLIPDV